MKLQTALCFILFTGCTFNSFSQNINNLDVSELVKLNFPLAEIEWEKPVSGKSVLLLNGGIGGGLSVGTSSSSGSYSYYWLAPYIGAGYRSYYNILKRAERGKNTLNNSANFFAINFTTHLPYIAASKEIEKIKNISLSLIPTWGMQRSLAKNFNFEWEAGGGVGTKNFKAYFFQPALGLKFSYLIKK